MPLLHLTAAGIRVAIAARGAELRSLRDGADQEYLWQAGPAWPRSAPVLFPVIGATPHEHIRHNGTVYPMGQHGFARDMKFECVEKSDCIARFALCSTDATLALFPFRFELQIAYRVRGSTLGITHTVINHGSEALPASLGAHPAFTWPLPGSDPSSPHTISFEHTEAAVVHHVDRVNGGLGRRPSPLIGQRLILERAVFRTGAVVFTPVRSRSVTYAGPDGQSMRIDLSMGFDTLAIWTLPDANFVCIEPWCGLPAPASYDDEYADKPGQFIVEPGETRKFRHELTLL